MKLKTIYFLVLIFAIAGMALSGYLTYQNYFKEGCAEALITCGSEPVEIFGLPTCVYGLGMFLAVAILSLILLKNENKRSVLRAVFVLSIIGTLFAGSLTYYELAVQGVETLPACVYGGVLYLLILIFSWIAVAKPQSPQV